MSRVVIVEGPIKQVRMEDLYKPLIRVPKNKRKGMLNNKDYVKVRANNKTVYCQILGTPKVDAEEIEMSSR